MGFNVNVPYLKFPPFQEAMGNFQVGKWEEGFAKLAEVERNYPTEPEVRALRQEMEVRSRINEYEVEEDKRRKRQKATRTGFRVFAIIVIAIIGFLAITTYSGWIEGQITRAQSDITKNLLQAELVVEFRNAQQLIIAGKSDEALTVYENIKTKNPDFPGLTDAISQAQALKDVEVEYTQALNLLQLGDAAQALSILRSINERMPNYRDVSLQIRNLQAQTEMITLLQQADLAFSEGQYEEALSGYESLRLMDPTFESKRVEDNLFQSYVKAAQARLAEPVPSLDTLKTIDEYFSNALALKPLDREALAARTQVRLVIEESMIGEFLSQAQAALAADPDSLEAQQLAEQYLGKALSVRPGDPNVLLQFQLATAYIQAINNFTSSKWDTTIEQLEYVVGNQANYANGTALQTLYDAYIARGSDFVAAGEYQMALDDFQRSAVLAQQLPDSEQLAFEAQTMIAEAQGLLNHLQEAVLIYQDALNSIGLRARIVALDNSLTTTLSSAEYSSSVGDYTSAFYAYRTLIRNRVEAYNQSNIVTIKSGDYITSLAHRYNTTVSAILSANKMANQPRLTPNTQLIIPILP
jgi:tetratricopeptide (TPR) repeat protein